ncbi:MAG: amidohydrolase family protein [Planctomycetota bacterium]|nr:amidohydrolase family protein [Planctomycetota bacterium]
MISSSTLACTALLSLLASSQLSQTPNDQVELTDAQIVGGWVFDSASARFTRNPGLAIRGGRFVKFSASEPTSQRIELSDQDYILPGLIDGHAHYNVKLIKKRREEFNVLPVQYLANGVTVTFSCGEFDPEEMQKLRKRIEQGKQVGPRLINSGPYFGRARPGWRGIKPADEIRQEVDFWVAQGVGGFKAKAISPQELKPLIDQAHHHDLTVTGHLGSGYRNSVNPRDAIGMGIDRVEHFLGGDAMPATESAYQSLARITPDMKSFQEIVQLYIDQKTWFDATITAYGYFGERGEEYDYWFDEQTLFTPYIRQRLESRPPRKPMEMFEQIYRAKQKTIRAFWQAGGRITLGTDHFSDGHFLPGFGAHRELDALVRSGIPAGDAIKIATINGAQALGIEADHGSIEVGKSADLFVIRGNPLEDIRRTRHVQQVMTGGAIYQSKKLLQSAKGKLGPGNDEEAADW